ncbi:hypothetical protein VPH35_118867 [Triticum aestivum]
MDGVEMIDENADHGGDGGGVKAQPGRPQFGTWIDRIVMPPSVDPNQDGHATTAEPEQCSRYACLCYAVLIKLVIATIFVTLMLLSIQLHPTTSGDRALHVIGHVAAMIGSFIVVLGFVLLFSAILETFVGNPEGYRMVDLLFM